MSFFNPKRMLRGDCRSALVGIAQGRHFRCRATFPYPSIRSGPTPTRSRPVVDSNYQSIGSGGGIKQIKARRDVRCVRYA